MSDVNYNVNATVTGGEDVEKLADNMERIGDDSAIAIDGTGVTETAEGLESISGTDADTKLGDVGSAAETTAPKVGVAAGAFQNMVAAIGLVNIATAGADIAIGAVKEQLAAIARVDAWNEAQVQGYKEAVLELGAGLDAIQEHLTNIADEDFESVTGLFGLGGQETLNTAASFGTLGITISDVMAVVQGGEPELAAMRDRLNEIGLGSDVTGAQMGFLESQQAAYHTGVAEGSAVLNFYAESQDSANRALQAMLTNRDPMSSFTAEWALLVESISDGSLDTTAAANALNTLSSELGLSTEEVLALAQAQVDEGVAGAQAYAEAIGSIDFQTSDIQGATTAMAAFTTGLFAAGNEAQAREGAFDALATSAEGVALTFDMGTDAGRAQQDALEGVARVIDTDLTQAYDAANGSQEAFVASATQLGDETLARLQTELGLTDGQVNTLRNALGLTAADYEARFELAGAAEAQLQIGLLQGAISGLPPETELAVNTLILQGDYVGARDVVATYYGENPVSLATEGDTSGAEGDFTDFADQDREATITAAAETATAASDLLDTAAESRTAIIQGIALTSVARTELDALAAPRTATINAELGDYPTADEIRRSIGPVRVPVQAYWNTRIEGNRPQ